MEGWKQGIKDQKGVTLPEILFSLVAFMFFALMSYQFIENFTVEGNKTGDFFTARLLSISALEDARDKYKKEGTKVDKDFASTTKINGVYFKTRVKTEDKTNEMTFLSEEVYMTKITVTTEWKLNKVEVESYVTKE